MLKFTRGRGDEITLLFEASKHICIVMKIKPYEEIVQNTCGRLVFLV
jgi:hypothetical protein